MANPQVRGAKRGVLLVNKRVELPGEYPSLDRLDQVTFNPLILEITQEGSYWRITGSLNACLTYNYARPLVNRDREGPAETGELAHSLGEKSFFDDGFSDHDEFAEEGALLQDSDPASPESGRDTVVRYIDGTQFSGVTPGLGSVIPDLTKLTANVVDVELKTPTERILDISAIVTIDEVGEFQLRDLLDTDGYEFQHTLAISSWPPGMAEVVEWQVGFNSTETVILDREIMVKGEMLVQIIGVEKEGEERDFTCVFTQAPITLQVPIPQGTMKELINGVTTEMLEVKEDAAGLIIVGLVRLELAEPVQQPEERMDLDADLEIDLAPEQLITEQLGTDELTTNGLTTDELTTEQLDQQISEPGTLQSVEVNELILEGCYSDDMDPDAEELLRKVDVLLEEIPSLEDVLGQPLTPTEQEGDVVLVSEPVPAEEKEAPVAQQQNQGVKYKLNYSGSKKISHTQAETQQIQPRSLSQLRHLIREKAVHPVETDSTEQSVAESSLQDFPAANQLKSRVNWTLYLVKQGESLESVSQRYNIDGEALRAKNALTGNLEAGQFIWIPK
ncbi:MAG TPA: LysM peptidoglycan-binding domain-containing protein [Bacillota bacterium]|nr:LysM peptidoglycan-binding domain-containing protein [Bacillota bacterium]